MPIRVHEREGRMYPVIECDHCGRTIEETKDSTAMHRDPWEGSGPNLSEVAFVHNRCIDPLEAKREGDWYTEDLDVFLVQIGLNVKLDMEATMDNLRFRARHGL